MSNNSTNIEDFSGIRYILLFRLIVWGYAGIALSLFGIFGNIITILVLTSPSMRTTSTNIYLTALSCSNIIFLLIFIPSYSMRYLLGYKLYLSNQPPFAFEILLNRLPTTPIYNTILLSIIYLTIAVSMDRLVLIKFPLNAKRMLTPRITLINIASIYIFSIVYCIPYWFEQRYVPELKHCVLTNFGIKMHKYVRIYSYTPVVYVIPFLTLTSINITIILNLLAKNQRKKSLGARVNRKKQGDYHITLMLVTVIIVFVLSQLPLLILNAWYAIDRTAAQKSLVFQSLNSLGTLLIVLNTSTNFLLYCFFGQKFRQTLLDFLGPLGRKWKSSHLQARIEKQIEERGAPVFLSKIPLQNLAENSKNKRSSLPLCSNEDKILYDEVKPETVPLVENIKPSLTTPPKSPESTKVDCNIITVEKSVFKPDTQPNLYTCSNGKTIVVLKI